MSKYRALFLQYLHEFFTYRLRVVFYTLSQLISPLVMIMVFSGMASITTISMNKAQLINYYLLTSFFYLFLNSKIDDFVKHAIQEGDLANSLLKPINYWVICLIQDLANRFGKFILGIPIMVVLVILNPAPLSNVIGTNQFLYFMIIPISFFLSFFICFALGLLAFWLDEVWGFQNVKEVLFIFFGGVALPYQVFPHTMQKLLSWTPFPYLINWPMRAGIYQPLLLEITVACFWLIMFIFISILGWKKGLKKYCGMGI